MAPTRFNMGLLVEADDRGGGALVLAVKPQTGFGLKLIKRGLVTVLSSDQNRLA